MNRYALTIVLLSSLYVPISATAQMADAGMHSVLSRVVTAEGDLDVKMEARRLKLLTEMGTLRGYGLTAKFLRDSGHVANEGTKSKLGAFSQMTERLLAEHEPAFLASSEETLREIERLEAEVQKNIEGYERSEALAEIFRTLPNGLDRRLENFEDQKADLLVRLAHTLGRRLEELKKSRVAEIGKLGRSYSELYGSVLDSRNSDELIRAKARVEAWGK